MFFIRFLLRNLRGYYGLVAAALVATFLQVESDVLQPFPLKIIADKLVTPHKDPGAPFIGILNLMETVKAGQEHSATAVVVFAIAILIVLGVISAGLAYVQLYVASLIGQRLSSRLRKQLFDHLQRLSLDWHGKQKKGDLVQRITGDIASLEKLVTDGMVDLLGAVLTLISIPVTMFLLQVQMTLISIVILPALFVVVFAYTKGIKAAAKQASKAAGQVADVAVEDVGAITVLKAFSLEDREAIRFNRYVGKNEEAAMRAGGLQAQFTPLVTLLSVVGTAVILGMGAFALLNNKFPLFGITPVPALTLGTLTIFLAYLKQVYQPMRDLSKLTNLGTSAAAGAERIQEVLDQAPEVLDPVQPYAGPRRLRGDIAFENVVFGYVPERPILKGINLHIPVGRKVALVGLSGGGKTTLVKLIPRFYEAQQGSVKIDGYDTRAYPLDVLRQNVSQVLQESVLFEGTILENIKIGRPDATMDQIMDAARQAQIHETIMKMPDGYGTRVREQGKNFSGGQRQRLAIARAILTNAPILVLDEPTASLDVEAEAEVLRALDTLVVGRTVLMISHRLSTLGSVDEIIVLKDGLIAEQGSYQELKRRNGIFAGLLKEQNRYNVDYAGKSMIVPRAEMARLVGAGYQGSQGLAPAQSAVSVPPWASNSGNGGRAVVVENGSRQVHGAHTPQNARIVVVVDGKTVNEVPLSTQKIVFTVGRHAGTDIVIPSQRVSRLHTTLHLTDAGWLIRDEGSLNGMVYQGQRVNEHVLHNGDQLYLAPRVLLYYKEVV